MILPICFDPFVFDEYRFFWEYAKHLYHCHKEKWPIISHEKYIDYPWNWDDSFYERHEFHELTQKQIDSVERYYVPDKLFENLANQLGSRLAMRIHLLNERYEPLEELLEKYISNIKKNNNEPIEAIINWAANYKSVRYIAAKHKIPIVTNEYCLRHIHYRSTVYFCFDEIYTTSENDRRYENFTQTLTDLPHALLTNEELLTIFLSDLSVEQVRLFNKKPEYSIGIAGCHPLMTTFFCRSMYTDMELVQDVKSRYGDQEILFRMHPGDEPYQADYGLPNQDKSPSSIQFILRCSRIAAQGSNILPEALLWGKMVYTHDVSPFSNHCEPNFSNYSATRASLSYLNYMMFNFLAPMELAYTPDYIRWRLSGPSEIEIYNFHLNYYLQKMELTPDILSMDGPKRLRTLMRARGL